VSTWAGIYVGVLLVALLRFVRTRERRLVPVLALFALLAIAQTREPYSRWTGLCHLAAGFSGLALVFSLAPHPPGRTQ
jgi:hypothetical protein